MSAPTDPSDRTAGATEPHASGGPARPSATLQIEQAFAEGNYARVRELAESLSRDPDPTVADRARALAKRVSVDPVQIAVLVACLALVLFVVVKYVPLR